MLWRLWCSRRRPSNDGYRRSIAETHLYTHDSGQKTHTNIHHITRQKAIIRSLMAAGTCSPTFHCPGSHWSTYRQHAPRRPIYPTSQNGFHTLRRRRAAQEPAEPSWPIFHLPSGRERMGTSRTQSIRTFRMVICSRCLKRCIKSNGH